MKKFLALLCMITCVLGLTACGNETALSEYEQQKVSYAEQVASQKVLPLLASFMDDANAGAFDENTAGEIEYMISNEYQLNVEGNAVISAIDSFHSTAYAIGQITEIGAAATEIKGDEIIVLVEIMGEKKNATAEIIFSNDMFMVLKSAALNQDMTTSEKMGKAVGNTLIGMGTVFSVLILISLLISCFVFIPRIQAKFEKKNKKADDVKPVAPAAPVVVPAVEEQQELSDDSELVAVIAAAIAASEGAVSVDGFVVRSIRKVSRR